jgi:hypothetical protein
LLHALFQQIEIHRLGDQRRIVSEAFFFSFVTAICLSPAQPWPRTLDLRLQNLRLIVREEMTRFIEKMDRNSITSTRRH